MTAAARLDALLDRLGRRGWPPESARWLRHLLPLDRALNAVIEVMERGAATHPGGDWRAHSAACHVARAREHLRLLCEGDTSEPHLAHATCRLLMALEVLGDARPRP